MIRPDIGQKKFENYLKFTFTAVKKTEKTPISPNFNPNNLKLYMRVGTHLGHNYINWKFLWPTVC
jgi:hypothetical protein